MYIFVLVGGFGTRLKSVVNDLPKPLAPINDKPFLEIQLSYIQKYFPDEKIYLLTYYKSEIIEKYFSDAINIQIIKESEPLGTGGSILNAIKELKIKENEQLLVLNGDTYFEVDLKDFVNSSKCPVNMICTLQNDCSRYGTVKIEQTFVREFREKANLENQYINSGCYFFNNINFFKDMPLGSFSLEDEFIKYLNNNTIKAYNYEGVFIDIGIPSDYDNMKIYMREKNE